MFKIIFLSMLFLSGVQIRSFDKKEVGHSAQPKEINLEKIESAVRMILEEIDPNPEREGLRETPKRVAKFYKEFFGHGLGVEPSMKQFKNSYGHQTIALTNIKFTSFCEHHMLPFSGEIHLGYIPQEKVLGLSKLARVVVYFSKRLQIQERIAEQVLGYLIEKVAPLGGVAVISSEHSCVTCRGVEKKGARMKTILKKGLFEQNPELVKEFLSVIQV